MLHKLQFLLVSVFVSYLAIWKSTSSLSFMSRTLKNLKIWFYHIYKLTPSLLMFHGCWQTNRRLPGQKQVTLLLTALQTHERQPVYAVFPCNQVPRGWWVWMDTHSGSQLRNSGPRGQHFFFFKQAAGMIASNKQASLPFPERQLSAVVPWPSLLPVWLIIRILAVSWNGQALQTVTLSKNMQVH